ncbi:MAG: F0F1 ATP synthase subunit delta [Alphaproteobacteria bacterium]|nr:F0F1 ATP synthase subunit delta [Alphaproteobacteria bacterium]
MSVDFTTVLAQIVNFTILIFVLYKFLYKPLLVAIAKREKHIADEVQNAENLAAEAEKKLEDLNKRYLDIDNERTHILNEAREDADKLRKQLEHEAQAEILEKKLIWQQELDREKTLLTNEFRQAVVENFLEFARKAFKNMADQKLEESMIRVFKRKLEELPRKDKKLLVSDAQEASVQISASEELTPEIQTKLKQVLIDVLEMENPQVDFVVNPRLLCGIEVSVDGNVVSWNLDDYLNTFTTKMNDVLENISLRMGREEG